MCKFYFKLGCHQIGCHQIFISVNAGDDNLILVIRKYMDLLAPLNKVIS